jgi:hypothetical protein
MPFFFFACLAVLTFSYFLFLNRVEKEKKEMLHVQNGRVPVYLIEIVFFFYYYYFLFCFVSCYGPQFEGMSSYVYLDHSELCQMGVVRGSAKLPIAMASSQIRSVFAISH